MRAADEKFRYNLPLGERQVEQDQYGNPTPAARLSIVRKTSGIGFQPVDVKSQAGSLCHHEEPTVNCRSMLKKSPFVFFNAE